MKYLKLISAGFLMSLLVACSSDDDGNETSDGNGNNTIEISDEPISGTIDDEDFVLAGAIGEITFEGFVDGVFVENDGVEKLRFALSTSDFGCGMDLNSEIVDVRATVITVQEGIQETSITTATATGIVIQSRGLSEIVSINDTEAEIKILTTGADLNVGANYELEGLFTVTICPEPQISVAP